MASPGSQLSIILFIYALASPASTDRCNRFYENEEAKEKANKRTILEFYRGFANPQNFEAVAKKFIVAEGYIQHNPIVADGREAVIASFRKLLGNSTSNPVDFIAHMAADGDLVWTHERDTINGTQYVIVNMYRLDCGRLVEHWDTTQQIVPNTVYANSHPFF